MKKMIDVAEISVSYQPVVGWDTQPKSLSSEDAYRVLKIFYSLRKAASLMDMKLVDHPILSPVGSKYYSIAENNLLEV